MIREQAMQKRVAAEEIARSIINANEILSVKKLRSQIPKAILVKVF